MWIYNKEEIEKICLEDNSLTIHYEDFDDNDLEKLIMMIISNKNRIMNIDNYGCKTSKLSEKSLILLENYRDYLETYSIDIRFNGGYFSTKRSTHLGSNSYLLKTRKYLNQEGFE